MKNTQQFSKKQSSYPESEISMGTKRLQVPNPTSNVSENLPDDLTDKYSE
jgi:hypothetical protein